MPEPHRHQRRSTGSTRARQALPALVATAILAGCGSGVPSAPSSSSGTSSSAAPSAEATTADASVSALCGFRTGAPDVTKIMVIWEENHSYRSIVGSSDAPVLNKVARQCGLATNAGAITHPSLPNYLSTTSGVSYARAPFNGDCSPGGSCLAQAPSIFAQEATAGHQWRSYAESMPHPCAASNAGPYAVRHNPAAYYPAIAAQCAKWDVPLGSASDGPLATAAASGTLPAFSTLTPNVNHDMHDGTVAQADQWLGSWLPVITGGPDYRSGRLVVLIVWDEGAGGGNNRSTIPLIVLSASTPAGTRSATAYDDYSILRTAEQLTGVAYLGQAASATSLAPAFHL